jgi:hypothetical protein
MMCFIPPPLNHSHHERHNHRHHHPHTDSSAAVEDAETAAGEWPWQRASEECRNRCGGVECGGLVQCFAKANQSCGSCVFVGGWWAPDSGYCFIGSKSTPEVKANCILGDGTNVCLRREPECPACERIQPPLRCTPQVAVVIVASIITAAFLALFAWTCWRAEHRSHFADMALEKAGGSRKCTPESGPADKRPGGVAFRTPPHSGERLGSQNGTAVESHRTGSIAAAGAGFGINTSMVSSDACATRADTTGPLPPHMSDLTATSERFAAAGGAGGHGSPAAAAAGTSPSQQMARRREADTQKARRRSSSTSLPPLPKRTSPQMKGVSSPPPAGGTAEAPLAPDYRSTPPSSGATASSGPSGDTVPHRRGAAASDSTVAAADKGEEPTAATHSPRQE